MEYKVKLQEFAPSLTEAEVAAEVARIKELSARNCRKEVYAFALSAVDLTTLTCNDSVESVSAFAKRAVDFSGADTQGRARGFRFPSGLPRSKKALHRSAFSVFNTPHQARPTDREARP